MTQDRFPMTIGGEEVLNEHHLLAYTENGEMMDSPQSVRFLVIHCSATRADRNYTDKQLMRDHKKRGFRTVGYHFYVHKDGSSTQFRKLLEVGAHARPYNRCSIGICYEGGLDDEGRPADTLTRAQYDAMWNTGADCRAPRLAGSNSQGVPLLRCSEKISTLMENVEC